MSTGKIISTLVGTGLAKDENVNDTLQEGVSSLFDFAKTAVESSSEVTTTTVTQAFTTLRTYITETNETERAKIEAEKEIKIAQIAAGVSDGGDEEATEDQPEDKDEETKEEDKGGETKEEEKGDGLFVNFDEDTKGTDGKTIFGGCSGVFGTISYGGGLGLLTVSQIDVPQNGAAISGPNRHVQQARANILVKDLGKGAKALDFLFPRLSLNPTEMNGRPGYIKVRVQSRMGDAHSEWTATASTKHGAKSDPVQFGTIEIRGSDLEATSLTAISLPLDFGGKAQAKMQLRMTITTGFE
jgi:hypothetical protein